ncbi:MAG: putative Zn-dependent protease [Bradymonadia bacterium]|jgi:predicted Zn-dependent protease
MNLTTLINGPALFAIVAIIGVAIWLVWPKRRRPTQAPNGPSGVGAALAYALDGNLPEARARLTHLVRAGGGDRPDAVLGLVAVLRAQGDFARAAAIVRGLQARQATPWLRSLCVRLCLDAGHVDRAAAFVDESTPDDLGLAALCRADEWSAGLARLQAMTAPVDAATEAGVLAGWAADRLRNGEDRSARKRLKRAVALAPESVAVLAIQSRFAARPIDRTRAEAALDARVGRNLRREDGIDAPTAELLVRAETLVKESNVEAAMGILRDALDRTPENEPTRAAYDRLILEHGAPEDWRAALADRAEMRPVVLVAPPTLGCGRCGLVTDASFFVCPRCDRFDTLQADIVALQTGVHPSAAGCGVEDLRQ